MEALVLSGKDMSRSTAGRAVARVFRWPGAAARIVVDRILGPWWLNIQGVEIGKHCWFSGIPVIKMAPGSRIVLGDGVFVSNRQYANPATMPHRCSFSTMSPGAVIEIGEGAGLSGVSIVAKVGVRIGARTLIGSGAMIWDTDFHPLDPRARQSHPTEGALAAPISIGKDVFIGARAIVLKGVSIGDGVVVGAGAVVVSDVQAGNVVGGNPSRIIRRARDGQEPHHS